MRYFLDTEFLDDGKSIELISIGIVSELGTEYYAVLEDCDPRVWSDPWLSANVMPSLYAHLHGQSQVESFSDAALECRRKRSVVRDEVAKFLEWATEIWVDTGAYDWVALCQLFGRMADKPNSFPYHFHELRTIFPATCINIGIFPEVRHNALVVARWVKYAWEAIRDADVSGETLVISPNSFISTR